MAKSYLLPCECNHKLSIETRNAGTNVECPECSATLQVPKLRELKNLEPATANESATKKHNAPNPLKRLLFTLGLGIAVIAGVAGGFLYNYASNLVNKDQEMRAELAEIEESEALLEGATPGDLWDMHNTLKDEELPEWKEAEWNTNFAQGTILRNFAYGILGLAGIGLLVALSSFFVSNKS